MSDLMQIIAKSRPAAKAAGQGNALGQAASASRQNARYDASEIRPAELRANARHDARQERNNFADMVENDRLQNTRAQQARAKQDAQTRNDRVQDTHGKNDTAQNTQGKNDPIQATRTQDDNDQNIAEQKTPTQNVNAQDSQQNTVPDTDKIDLTQRPEITLATYTKITPETGEKISNALQKFSVALEQGDLNAIKKTGQDLLALLSGIEGNTNPGSIIDDLVRQIIQSVKAPEHQATPVATVVSTITDMLAKIDSGKRPQLPAAMQAADHHQPNVIPAQIQTSSAPTQAIDSVKPDQVLAPADLAIAHENVVKTDPLLAKSMGLANGLTPNLATGLATGNVPESMGENIRPIALRDGTQMNQQPAQAETKAPDPQTLLATLADRLSAASNQKPASNTSAPQLAAALPALAPATTIVTASPDGALVQIELSANGTQTHIGTAAAPARSFAGNLPGQLNLPNLAFEMSRQFANGNSRFEIRLDPPEMGRIDVRMEIDASGTVTARLSVEKAETLDYLQRDSRALERALEEAGLKGGETNLEFTLKGQDQGTDAEDNDWLNFAENEADENDSTDVIAAQMTHYSGIARPGGLNLLA